MKLSKVQLDILKKLVQGWNLRHNMISWFGGAEFYLRYGQEIKFARVNRKSARKLIDLGLVKQTGRDGFYFCGWKEYREMRKQVAFQDVFGILEYKIV